MQACVPASKILGALSYALDLTDGQPMGHSMQTCLIGMRIGSQLGLAPGMLSDLYYALLLKDAGCSSNSSKLFHMLQSDEIQAKRSLKDRDWTKQGMEQLRYAWRNVAVGKPLAERLRSMVRLARQEPQTGNLYAIRCERGASIARRIGFSAEVAEAIACLDEHWNGKGYPMHLAGSSIPLLSRIMNLAQCAAIFWKVRGARAAAAVLKQRSGRWFDPELVRSALSLIRQGSLFEGLDAPDIVAAVAALESVTVRLHLDGDALDDICVAFSEVIDTKSPYTYRHSAGVAKAAVAIGQGLHLPESTIVSLRRAALLHDIGKLAVPNSILEKPGKLDAAEWAVVKKHPYYTWEILKQMPGFEAVSEVAASHHERLDGSGYFRGYRAHQLCLQSRALAVADVYDALAATRPYREGLSREKVFAIMASDAPHILDMDCLNALQAAPPEALALPEVVRVPEEGGSPGDAYPALAPLFA